MNIAPRQRCEALRPHTSDGEPAKTKTNCYCTILTNIQHSASEHENNKQTKTRCWGGMVDADELTVAGLLALTWSWRNDAAGKQQGQGSVAHNGALQF